MMLDATMNQTVVDTLLPGEEALPITTIHADAPHAHVTQMLGHSFAKAHFNQDDGYSHNRLMRLAYAIENVCNAHHGKVLAVMQMDVQSRLEPLIELLKKSGMKFAGLTI